MAVPRRRSTSKHVFLNRRGRPWTMNAVRLRIDRLKKKPKLADDVCSYLLRHAFGTMAIVNGVDPLTVAGTDGALKPGDGEHGLRPPGGAASAPSSRCGKGRSGAADTQYRADSGNGDVGDGA